MSKGLRRFNTRTPKVRSDSRTIPIPGHQDYGDGKDADRYWKCWNCGFRADVTRDDLGGSEDLDGVEPGLAHVLDASSFATQVASLAGDLAYNTNIGALAAVRSNHVLLELDADGTPKTIRQDWTPDVFAGCPMCGTRNWRGDY